MVLDLWRDLHEGSLHASQPSRVWGSTVCTEKGLVYSDLDKSRVDPACTCFDSFNFSVSSALWLRNDNLES